MAEKPEDNRRMLVVKTALAIVQTLNRTETDRSKFIHTADTRVKEILESSPPEGDKAVVVEPEMMVRFAFAAEDEGTVKMIPEIWGGFRPPELHQEVILENVRKGNRGAKLKVALRARPKTA